MSGRFIKKARVVRLVNEPEPDEDDFDVQMDSDRTTLINEDEEHAQNSTDEEELHTLSPNSGAMRWNWRFWKKQKRYELTPEPEGPGRKVTVCGRTFHLCRINSWRAIFLVLFVFSVTITISVIISKLASVTNATNHPQGVVVSDAAICANMSADILLQAGSAVDAAITAMLCNGVVQPESSGIGGGGFMIIRLADDSVYSINFRETAPRAATEDMFHSNSSLSQTGGLSVAVPGEIKGMETAHRLFGKLRWKSLFAPVIELCRNGFNLTQHSADAVQSSWGKLAENIREIYRAKDGGIKKAGDLVKRPRLAETLEMIAANGSRAFYEEGEIAQSIVDTVNASGGIITAEDLASYEVRIETPLQTQFNGHTFFSPPSPAGGPAFLFVLSLMDLYRHNSTSDPSLVYHRLVESFKFAFAQRSGLGDPYCNDTECEDDSREINQTQANMFNASYVSEIWSSISDKRTFHNISHYHPHYSSVEDSGTSHISVLSPEGEAVAVTTTVNTYFGSKLMTSTGIVLNNEMDDFSSPNITNAYSLPPSRFDFIRPGKRPLSSACPTIAVRTTSDGVQPYMVIGASGGSTIPTSVAQAVLRVATFRESISDAIEAKRVHHQLLPDNVHYTEGFPESILDFLRSRGHNVTLWDAAGVVQGVVLDEEGRLTAHADSRKGGAAVIVDTT